MSTKTYIKHACDLIEKRTKSMLKNYSCPLDSGNLPNMDDYDLFPPNNISVHQLLIGCLKWAVILGRWDVQYTTKTPAQLYQNLWDGEFEAGFASVWILETPYKRKTLLWPYAN